MSFQSSRVQKFAAGHPKFGAECEVRVSPWVFALFASRLDAPRVPNKSFLQNREARTPGSDIALTVTLGVIYDYEQRELGGESLGVY